MFRWLDRPLAEPWCVLGWVVATAAFVLAVQVQGGPASGDSQESIYAAWAIAHGHAACGYPAPGVPGYFPTAPLYVLVSAALVAVLGIGHAVAFPGGSQLGAHCSSAAQAMQAWSLHAGALAPTLRIGLVGWAFLLAGVVCILRASGRGRRGWEPVALIAVACMPPVSMCLAEYFHPQDLFATGLALVSLSLVRNGRWAWAGVAIGLAVASQQFALLVAVPLLVVAPSRHRARFLGAGALSLAVVALPLAALTSGRALTSVLVGTGESTVAPSLLALTHAHGSLLFSMSRILPIAIAAFIAGVAAERLGTSVLEPVALVSLVATSLCLRLVFEVNVWGYYLLAASVLLIVLDVVRGRVRAGLVVWVGLVIVAARGGVLDYAPTFLHQPIWAWQLVLDAGALALAASPLVRAARAEAPMASQPADEQTAAPG